MEKNRESQALRKEEECEKMESRRFQVAKMIQFYLYFELSTLKVIRYLKLLPPRICEDRLLSLGKARVHSRVRESSISGLGFGLCVELPLGIHVRPFLGYLAIM